MNRIPLWVDLRHVPVHKRLPYLKAMRSAAAEKAILATGDPHLERDDLDVLTIDGRGLLRQKGKVQGRSILVTGAKSQEKATQGKGIVIVEAKDWRIIPLENLIAARRDRPGTLYAVAVDAEQAALFARTLDVGVDGVVLRPASPAAIEAADLALRRGPDLGIDVVGGAPSRRTPGPGPQARQGPKQGRREATAEPPRPTTPTATPGGPKADKGTSPFLVEARLTGIRDAGIADRVCVDTTTLFRDDEGLLVGSTATSFCLVVAETLENPYVAPRPFRVNAGAVHSYLFLPEGKTRYLSELTSGDAVLAIHPDGVHRVVRLGRAKVERRPHLMLTWRGPRGDGSAIVQHAETVRIATPSGARAVTELREGDMILIHEEKGGRHFGMPIGEADER